MSNIISKELLSLVLGIEITRIDYKIKGNELEVLQKFYSHSDWVAINLDTLGRLYKEWCWEQGYYIALKRRNVDCYKAYPCVINRDASSVEFVGITELEAIIKATEWVAKDNDMIESEIKSVPDFPHHTQDDTFTGLPPFIITKDGKIAVNKDTLEK